MTIEQSRELLRLVPAVVLATGEQVRAARKALGATDV